MNKRLRILFIGNSHTYFNDMPDLVALRARKLGYDCEVTMIAHGGWFLEQHVQEPDVRFNILMGHYDYVVLQEHSHPFAPVDKYLSAVRDLKRWIDDAESKCVIYGTWAMQHEEFNQAHMNEVNRRIAAETGSLLAPVGELWWDFMRSRKQNMYFKDGAHASFMGSDFAAMTIWDTIYADCK